MAKITFTGLDDLTGKLKKNAKMDDVKRIVKNNGAALQRLSQQKADFRGHYEWKPGVGRVMVKPTGKLKGSIKLEMKDGGLTAEVEPQAEYAAYVEFGTRFMDAQPYLKPAWEIQKEKFKRDLDKLVR